MYSLILHGRRSLELHKWHNLRVSVQNAFSFSNSFSSYAASARDGQKGQVFTFCYLVDSLGLTATLAESISKKASFRDKGNPDSVLSLFRSYGFTDSQISSMVTNYPGLLMLDAEKCLGPKLQVLKSMEGGSSSDQLIETISKVPKLLGMKGDKTISRYYDVVKETIKSGKSSKFEKLCHSLPHGLQRNKIRNASVLRELGVPQRLLNPLLVSDHKLVCGDGKFKETLKKVIDMGFDPTSSQFVQALGAVQWLSDNEIEEKAHVYRKLGFSVRDVWEMFLKYPISLRFSEDNIKQTFEVLKKCGLREEEILSVFKKFPQCIGYSRQKICNSLKTCFGLGFSLNQFSNMVQRFPQWLNISPERVKKRTRFLVKKKNKLMLKKMKWSLKGVALFPQVLGVSMEKRIVPSERFRKEVGSESCTVVYFAGIVYSQLHLLRICLRFDSELRKDLRESLLQRISGFHSCYFFDGILKMLLVKSYLHLTPLLGPEDEAALIETITEAVIESAERLFINPGSENSERSFQLNNIAINCQGEVIRDVDELLNSTPASYILKFLLAQFGREGNIFTVSYLVESISRKVSSESKANPDSVLSLLKHYGFTDSQISSIVRSYQRLLITDAEKISCSQASVFEVKRSFNPLSSLRFLQKLHESWD
ncbi:hypothetical protein Bca52824_069350 [Brassica carinata]|uniref:Mitochondrial transcription termination factor family protein n=1 Tax=Brassica carinata TaxID=52824 RepID=A0A8X7Q262_BRACI|nr:hypothetical protein Bca52824_069350 [Brassica carinata]